MTLEEAKQLKHGDIVLVEMEVMKNSYDGTERSCGQVLVRVPGMEKAAASLRPYQMREKVRKFCEGDIVFYKNMFCHVLKNSDGVDVYIAKCGADVNPRNEWLVVLPSELKLVTPAETREDRKEEV